MKKLIKKLSVIILFIACLLMLVGCEGSIQIQGEVYEWINALQGSKSIILIENTIDENVEETLNDLLDRVSGNVTKVPLFDVEIIVDKHKDTEVTAVFGTCDKLALRQLRAIVTSL